MITLYTFGPMFGLPDPSPFVTKAEVLLKMAKLAYRTDSGGFAKAPKGKLPYIDDDGPIVHAAPVAAHLPRRLCVRVEGTAELAGGRAERPVGGRDDVEGDQREHGGVEVVDPALEEDRVEPLVVAVRVVLLQDRRDGYRYDAGENGYPDRLPTMSKDELTLRNWQWSMNLSGDIFVEQDIHVVDICNWVLNGHPVSEPMREAYSAPSVPLREKARCSTSIRVPAPPSGHVTRQCARSPRTNFAPPTPPASTTIRGAAVTVQP